MLTPMERVRLVLRAKPRCRRDGMRARGTSSRSMPIENLSCPTPLTHHEQITLGHGSGGRLAADLLHRVFLPELGNPVLSALEDQADCRLGGAGGQRMLFTTDSFVVRPIFFPGGDIGRLAVHGTVKRPRGRWSGAPLSLRRVHLGRRIENRRFETDRGLDAGGLCGSGCLDRHRGHQGR